MSLLPALLLFAFTSSITPGPNNVMILTSGLNYGVRRSLQHLAGIVLGFPAMIIILGMGAGIVFNRYPVIHEVIKVAGLLYLLYLAWRIATAEPGSLDAGARKPLTFIQSALFQWLNPKGWMMAMGALATFTTSAGNELTQVLVIALVFFVGTILCSGSWLIFGVTLKHVLSQKKYMQLFNRVMALLLVISVLPILEELLQSWF